MRIYTRKGDRGTTDLLDGTRVAKTHRRVSACGEVDELSAVLGVVRAQTDDHALAALLAEVQKDLFALGAQLADPKARIASRRSKARLSKARIGALERAIDERETALPPLPSFVLAGGGPVGALLHLARTVCRRAERAVVAVDRHTRVDPLELAYLNRLSDLLFVLARYDNHRSGRLEETW